jgi:hypothetical protein
MSSGPQKFWMVVNPKAEAPKQRHGTLAEATAEANRLAVKYPGSNFYVLEALGYAGTGNAKAGGEFGPVQMHEL